jgi:RNA polymerase sigma factor (sigma-70 family)
MNFERSFNKALLEGDVEEIKRLSSCLYEAYSRLAYQVAFSILGNEEEAKDAVSEAFVSFLSHLNDIGKIKNIKYYLLSSIRYISYRQKRKRKRR